MLVSAVVHRVPYTVLHVADFDIFSCRLYKAVFFSVNRDIAFKLIIFLCISYHIIVICLDRHCINRNGFSVDGSMCACTVHVNIIIDRIFNIIIFYHILIGTVAIYGIILTVNINNSQSRTVFKIIFSVVRGGVIDITETVLLMYLIICTAYGDCGVICFIDSTIYLNGLIILHRMICSADGNILIIIIIHGIIFIFIVCYIVSRRTTYKCFGFFIVRVTLCGNTLARIVIDKITV